MGLAEADEEVVAQARGGSRPAFAELVRRHSRLVYRVAFRLSGNHSDAEEISQDAFLQLHRKLDSFKGDSKFSTWLYSVTLNAALMHLRERRRHVAERINDYLPQFDDSGTLARLDFDYSKAARADELVERQQLAVAALAAVSGLPEAYRLPYVLRDLEGLNTEETAALLGLDATLVRQRLHRARLILRAHLNKLVGADS